MTTLRIRGLTAPIPALSTPRGRLLLVLGDDELVSGHRSAFWTGVAPGIELDLAMATLSQDAINAADLWYQVLVGGELAGDDPDVRSAVDAIGLGREPDQYRHAIVCERPPRDIAYSLARLLTLDQFAVARTEMLAESSEAAIAELATRLRWELRYHIEHADHWVARFTTGDQAQRDRMAAAFRDVIPEANGLFESFEGEQEVVAAGVLPMSHADLRPAWVQRMVAMLAPFGIADLLDDETVPTDASGGREGRHSADFSQEMWPDMTSLYRSDPTATW